MRVRFCERSNFEIMFTRVCCVGVLNKLLLVFNICALVTRFGVSMTLNILHNTNWYIVQPNINRTFYAILTT